MLTTMLAIEVGGRIFLRKTSPRFNAVRLLRRTLWHQCEPFRDTALARRARRLKILWHPARTLRSVRFAKSYHRENKKRKDAIVERRRQSRTAARILPTIAAAFAHHQCARAIEPSVFVNKRPLAVVYIYTHTHVTTADGLILRI